MKKVSILVLAVLLVALLCINAAAAGEMASLSSGSTVSQNGDISFTIGLSAADVRGIAVVPDYDTENFVLVSGSWLISGIIADFSAEAGDGVIAFETPADINGQILTFTLRAKENAALGTQNVSCGIVLKDSAGTQTELAAAVATVTVECSQHSFGSYTADGKGHTHTCTLCKKIQTADHTWNAGQVTAEPTKTAAGVKTYTCTACSQTKTESIPALVQSGTNTGSTGNTGSGTTGNSGSAQATTAATESTAETTQSTTAAIEETEATTEAVDQSPVDGTQDGTGAALGSDDGEQDPSENNGSGWILGAALAVIAAAAVILVLARKKKKD